MSDEYQTRQFFEQRILNPKIQHINCSPNISDECLQIINKMVEIVFNEELPTPIRKSFQERLKEKAEERKKLNK